MRLLPFLFFVASMAALPAAPPDQWLPAPQPWDRSLGSHRVVVQTGKFPAGTRAVSALIEWRRPDPSPEKKAVIVHDLATGKPIPNVHVDSLSAESAQLTFEPVSGAGEYAVYFLPVQLEGGAFPVGKYLPPANTADATWLRDHAKVPTATAAPVRWEAVAAHDAWTSAEVIASTAEAAALAAKFPAGVAVAIPSDPRAVRMQHALPRSLATEGLTPGPRQFRARPGEYFVFPVVVWCPQRDLAGVQSVVRPTTAWADKVDALTTDRTDWNGKSSQAGISIPRGTVQAFWHGVQLPASGSGSFSATITDASGQPLADPLTITIETAGDPAADHGDGNPQSLSRLRWLNSSTAVDDEPVKGYEALTVTGQTIRCLGRELELGSDGLPVQIRSFFNRAITRILDKPTLSLLASPVQLTVAQDGSTHPLTGKGLQFTSQTPWSVEWTASLHGHGLHATLTGRMEGDGSVNYRIACRPDSDQPVSLDGLALGIPRTAASTEFVLGLQEETGIFPPDKEISWHWDTPNRHQDSLWLGSVHGGLRVQLKAENYVRPSVNIHYKRRPLNEPPSWNATGKGGLRVSPESKSENGPTRTLTAFSGPVTFSPQQPLHFNFDLLITPFHTLRTAEQWSERYYHTNQVPRETDRYLDSAKAASANVVNIHQGNWLNPYINYPFLTADRLAAFADKAHDRGMRSKYYYTVRELSNWCPELFAFRSMGDELLMSGKGGGHPWGEEHLHGNYWQAWFEPGTQDVSFLTQPMSRFHNYYIEGLRWLCENAGCDGIYLDDIAYDRSIMLRARKVLDRFCPRGGRIDLHSWNEFHEGGAWAHCPNIFMDSMPFVDRLWFGEGHHYSGPSPEHFLVEISGIPFGLMGEMLEGGGNPWLGLVFGCTGRLGWGGNPTDVWKLWDDFGTADAEFTGWWAGTDCPVQSNDPAIKATTWRRTDATMVAVANFSGESKDASLAINWTALGRDPAKAKLFFPAMNQMRQKAALRSTATDGSARLMLRPHSGAVFVIDEKEHDVAAPVAATTLGQTTLEDTFAKGLDPAWKPIISPQAPADSGRVDAGYVFLMPAHLHAFLERPISPDTGAVSARIWQDGKDEAQQWGPGLAVLWPNGQSLRTNIRKDGQLTVSANGSESLDASITSRAPVEFSIRWDTDAIRIIAAGPAMGDLAEEIARFPRSAFPGQPSIVRVGKMPHSAGPSDHSEPGPAGFSRIEWFRTHAPAGK